MEIIYWEESKLQNSILHMYMSLYAEHLEWYKNNYLKG